MSEQLQTEEVWCPKPTEWYQATVLRTCPEKRYIVLSLASDIACSAIEKNISPSGDHLFCRERNEEGRARVQFVDGKLQAIECRFGEPEVGHKEQIQIYKWFGSYGSARRSCSGGCGIFVISQNRDDIRDYKPGDIVDAVIELSERSGKGLIARLTPQDGNGEKA